MPSLPSASSAVPTPQPTSRIRSPACGTSVSRRNSVNSALHHRSRRCLSVEDVRASMSRDTRSAPSVVVAISVVYAHRASMNLPLEPGPILRAQFPFQDLACAALRQRLSLDRDRLGTFVAADRLPAMRDQLV